MQLRIEAKIDFSQILPKGTFLSDYARDPTGFSSFLHFHPGQEGEKIASFQSQSFPHRKAVVEYLHDYHRNLDAPPETLAHIASLNDPRTLVIMTGQQPGLLTGPLYTIYKTVSCLRQMQRIRQTFGLVCIPVFWIASEDHNLEESASVSWPETEGGGYRVLSIRPRRGHFKQPAGLLPLKGKKLSSFMLELEKALSPARYSQEAAHIIHSTLNRSGTLGEWFARLMLTFFGRCGLILVEPNHAGIKRLAAPLWEKVLADPLDLPEVVDQAGRELEQCGFRRQLPFHPHQCPFFLYENQGREGVTWDGRLFHTKNHDYSRQQMLELIQLQPERFSPNVYLRPVFSEFLFPTLCYFAGPGEAGYFAQIKGVYDYFELKMPIILPRLSATLHDARSGILQDTYPQERKLNIFYPLSHYGPDFLPAVQTLETEDYFSHYQLEISAEP
ncbi:MAG: bacillithiol biosynthesis cysteine-adding enzyme BshC [bacterium]